MALHTSGLIRDLEVLELLGTDSAWEGGGFGVLEIANLLARDKGQVSRVCNTLAKAGLVSRDRLTKRYRLGHHLYALAMRTQEAHLALLARPTLLGLMAQAEESSHLTVLRGGMIMTIHTELAQHPERDDSFDGVSLPALKTASGRAILATFTAGERAAWWEEHGEFREQPQALHSARPPETAQVRKLRRTPGSIRSLGRLHRECRAVRKLGYALSDGELTEHIVDAAAPLRNGAGVVVGAITVGAKKDRIRDGNRALGFLVSQSAAALSERLGWRFPA
ncbi:MAG: DNA-binding IclR family transcriptional regulator [Pontimonas sp.]|jgi:DNA-binding IclR family transcriptional regulator